MTNIRNLTPPAINIILDNGSTITIDPEGTIARVSVSTATVGSIDEIPITESVFGEVENLPEPNESVRDEEGRIIGCKSLGRI